GYKEKIDFGRLETGIQLVTVRRVDRVDTPPTRPLPQIGDQSLQSFAAIEHENSIMVVQEQGTRIALGAVSHHTKRYIGRFCGSGGRLRYGPTSHRGKESQSDSFGQNH